MDEIKIVDTTLRDGNTSLWAHNMTTGMMHPVLRHMDQAGFDAMEFFVAGRFKKVIREQLDNPWDWVRYGQKEIKNTQLRYHGGLTGGFILSPLCIPRLTAEAGHRLRHQHDAAIRSVERLRRAQRRSRRIEANGHDLGGQLDLFDLAAPHRRVLCAQSA